jgi:hypothetical protein
MCSNDTTPQRLVAPSAVMPFQNVVSAASSASPPAQVPQQPAIIPAATLEHYRLQLYNYALAERLRYTHPALLSAAAAHHPYSAGPLQVRRFSNFVYLCARYLMRYWRLVYSWRSQYNFPGEDVPFFSATHF